MLGGLRRQMCDKLSRVPLGYVKDMPSGSLKNIMMERTDSIETTLAHILPEFTANLLAPLLVFVYMLTIDWRMALLSLITLPLGLLCYMLMMIGYEENYRNVLVKTKTLNDTAVEYINGIEVIKAFGKAKSSYERFVTAAKEGASCYVEWMRKCDIPFSPCHGADALHSTHGAAFRRTVCHEWKSRSGGFYYDHPAVGGADSAADHLYVLFR